jgi:hypothetical protein
MDAERPARLISVITDGGNRGADFVESWAKRGVQTLSRLVLRGRPRSPAAASEHA